MDQKTETVENTQPIQSDLQTTTTLSTDQPKEAEVPKVDFKTLGKIFAKYKKSRFIMWSNN